MDQELKFAIRDLQDGIDLISGRWRLAILAVICDGEMRYSELKKTLVGITPKILTKELRFFEDNGMLQCDRGSISGNSAVYSLTPHARKLEPIITELLRWSEEHRQVMLDKIGSTTD